MIDTERLPPPEVSGTVGLKRSLKFGQTSLILSSDAIADGQPSSLFAHHRYVNSGFGSAIQFFLDARTRETMAPRRGAASLSREVGIIMCCGFVCRLTDSRNLVETRTRAKLRMERSVCRTNLILLTHTCW
jgi:hypothetical protein